MTRLAKRILVPLDHDEHSEAIVPLVAAVARDSGATVRLLRVYPVPEHIEGSHGRVIEYVDQAMQRLTAEGEDDLARGEAQMAGVPVERVVRFGEPAEEIALEAEAFHADLIALAEAPRGGLQRVFTRSIPEQVVHETSVPTLVLKTTTA